MLNSGILAQSIAINLQPERLQWCIQEWQSYQAGTSLDHQISKHKLWPTLEFCFRQNQLWEYLPSELQSRLQATRQQYALRQLQLISQLEELDAALTEKGLTGILLKGSALLFHQIYPSLGDRVTADIDIVVAPDQIPAFLEVLTSLNYLPNDPHLPEVNDQTHHLPPFERANSLPVEVHPLAHFNGFIQQFSNEVATTAEYPQGFTALQVPTPTELFWHMAWHTWFNMPQLRNILDLYQLQNLHAVDLAMLTQRAEQYQLQDHWSQLLQHIDEIVTGKPSISTIHRWEWYPKSQLSYCLLLPDRNNWQSSLQRLRMKSVRFGHPALYPGILLMRSLLMGITCMEWLISLITFRFLSALENLVLKY
jgi:Uncharacterised nucleotidyltransferase